MGDLLESTVGMNRVPIDNLQDLPSPALWVDPARVQSNIDHALASVGGDAKRLRPHLKTHKMVEVVRMQLASGITRFKASTLVEAEMAAAAGAADILVAHQLVGPKIGVLEGLIKRFGDVSFSVISDDAEAVKAMAEEAGSEREPLDVYIDIDCGMGRTGIPFDGAAALREAIEQVPGAAFVGLHVYDGHNRDPDLAGRRSVLEPVFAAIRDHMERCGPAKVVGGGSPSFGLWASQTSWQCSPGTFCFWDVRYASLFEDLPFEVAAGLVTRVISKPGPNRLCLDLGHKAVAAEQPLEKRVEIPALKQPRWICQSEEHLVVECANASELSVGDPLIGYPVHICPTVALHAEAHLIEGGHAGGARWPVAARHR